MAESNEPQLRSEISRRKFGQLALAGLAGATLLPRTLPALEKKDEKSPGWIDAHVHVWTPDTQAYPLDKNFTVSSMQPPSFTPEELFEHTKPSGVDRVVLIQMSFYRFDNSYMLDVISRYPKVFSGVGIVDHHAKNVARQMKKLARGGVRGFRLHAGKETVDSWVDDPGMARVWETASDEGLVVCPLINPQDLAPVEKLCIRYPKARVVIDHFARIGVSGTIEQNYLDQLCKMARLPNVYVKTSAFYALGKKEVPYKDLLPMIKRVVEAYGPERLMWASDCPYQVQPPHNYEAAIALVRDHAGFSASERQAILHDTAQKVFFG